MGQAGEIHAIGISVHEEGDFAERRVVYNLDVLGDEIRFRSRDDARGALRLVKLLRFLLDDIVVRLADMAAEREDDAEFLLGELFEMFSREQSQEIFTEVERVPGVFDIGHRFHRVGRDIHGREHEAADLLGEFDAKPVSFQTVETDGGVFAVIFQSAPRKINNGVLIENRFDFGGHEPFI